VNNVVHTDLGRRAVDLLFPEGTGDCGTRVDDNSCETVCKVARAGII